MAAIGFLQAHGDPKIAAHLLLDNEVRVLDAGDNHDEVLEPMDEPVFRPRSGQAKPRTPSPRTTTPRNPTSSALDTVPFDPASVPQDLRFQAGEKTTKVWETLLWVRQGEVGKMYAPWS